MRQASVVSLVVAATCGVAAAQLPGLVAAITEEPASYVGGGVVLGGVHSDAGGGLYGAFEIEGGFRVGNSHAWAHALLAIGGMTNLDDESYPTSNDYVEARVGIEGPICSAHSIACFFLGVDVGARHEHLTAVGSAMIDTEDLNANTAVVVPRLGFNVGNAHFRVRPSAEVALASDGGFGVALALSSASPGSDNLERQTSATSGN